MRRIQSSNSPANPAWLARIVMPPTKRSPLDHPLIFVTPNPPLATLKADIDALDAAETLALRGREEGKRETRVLPPLGGYEMRSSPRRTRQGRRAAPRRSHREGPCR